MTSASSGIPASIDIYAKNNSKKYNRLTNRECESDIVGIKKEKDQRIAGWMVRKKS